MARPPQRVSIITPVLPGRDQYLPETAASIDAARTECPQWQIEWILVIDGPGEVVLPAGADQVIALPVHSGIAASRNVGLAAATGEWVYPLDADDLLHPGGLAALLSTVGSGRCRWIACNRLRTDGSRTAHWHDAPHEWSHGHLPDYWTSPFMFHPGSLLVRRESALRVGGWPALPSNEGVAFALALGAKFPGRFRPEVVTLERDWEGQANRDSVYAQAKEISFATIAKIFAARTGSHIQPPADCTSDAHMQVDRDT